MQTFFVIVVILLVIITLSNSITYGELLSPLKQFKSGMMLNHIVCKPSLQLIIKIEDQSPACVKPTTASILLQRSHWIMYNSSNNIQFINMNRNFQTNHLPNVYQRFMNMDVGVKSSISSYLPITISDRLILEKPSNNIILQKLYPDWENRKSSTNNSLEVTDERGNDMGSSFFCTDTVGIADIGPSVGAVFFGNPCTVYIRGIHDIVTLRYSMDELGPINSTYHLKFSSLYPVKINLPDGIEIISNNTKTYSEFWITDNSGKSTISNFTYVPYKNSKIEIKNVILYDMTFK